MNKKLDNMYFQCESMYLKESIPSKEDVNKVKAEVTSTTAKFA